MCPQQQRFSLSRALMREGEHVPRMGGSIRSYGDRHCHAWDRVKCDSPRVPARSPPPLPAIIARSHENSQPVNAITERPCVCVCVSPVRSRYRVGDGGGEGGRSCCFFGNSASLRRYDNDVAGFRCCTGANPLARDHHPSDGHDSTRILIRRVILADYRRRYWLLSAVR